MSDADAFTPANVTALILAGSSGPGSEAERNKNFFRLRGRPVVQRAIDVARSMGFARVVLVTERARIRELDVPESTIVLESSSRQDENFSAVKAAVRFEAEERCLVIFGDTPLVSAAMIGDFLARCRAHPVEICHGLVPFAFIEPFTAYFPRDRAGRKPFHASEFTARLGCLSLVRPAAFDPRPVRARIQVVMQGRKQDPIGGGLWATALARARVLWWGTMFFGVRGTWVAVAAILAHFVHERGFPAAARWLSQPVTLARLDWIASRLSGCSMRLVPCPFGGASLDIDTEADLAVQEQYWEELVALQDLQERIVARLGDPAFDLGAGPLAVPDDADAAIVAEIRRHPEVYREQQRILRMFVASR